MTARDSRVRWQVVAALFLLSFLLWRLSRLGPAMPGLGLATFGVELSVTGSASMYFYVAAAINFIGLACWWGVRPEQRLNPIGDGL